MLFGSVQWENGEKYEMSSLTFTFSVLSVV